MRAQTFNFDAPLPTRSQANRARDVGMQQVMQHAEERKQFFGIQAQMFILAFLTYGPASGEVLTSECKKAGIVPHDDRAFGPVYMRLLKQGLIQKVGECRRLRGHNTSGGSIYAAV
jgi:hypothetical protein